jgi:hypothetical protein
MSTIRFLSKTFLVEMFLNEHFYQGDCRTDKTSDSCGSGGRGSSK